MPAEVSCAGALVREAERDVAGHCRPFDRRPHTPDWPAPRNPVIAPITVLLGHANDQLLDFSLDPRPTGASRGFRAIEFAGDQLAVPGQDSVRPGHIGHLAENLAAQSMTDLTERGSLGVRESRPSFQLRPHDRGFGA